MKVRCIHGYFIFDEVRAGQLSEFMSLTGFEIESNGDHFTFSDLVDAPDYSIPGGTFLGIPTSKAFAGRPWDVMRENGLVYDFSKGLILPILSVITLASIRQAQNYFVSSGLILPGSLTDDGGRITDYVAFFNSDLKSFRYSEVAIE